MKTLVKLDTTFCQHQQGCKALEHVTVWANLGIEFTRVLWPIHKKIPTTSFYGPSLLLVHCILDGTVGLSHLSVPALHESMYLSSFFFVFLPSFEHIFLPVMSSVRGSYCSKSLSLSSLNTVWILQLYIVFCTFEMWLPSVVQNGEYQYIPRPKYVFVCLSNCISFIFFVNTILPSLPV